MSEDSINVHRGEERRPPGKPGGERRCVSRRTSGEEEGVPPDETGGEAAKMAEMQF